MSRTLDPFDKSTWSDDERRYFELLDEAFDCEENETFSNGQVEHASYIIHKFLTNAQEKVRIFSGKPSRTHNGFSVYGNDHITEAVKRFLERPGSELMIVVEDGLDVEAGQDPHDHPVVRAAEEAKRAGTLQGTLAIRCAADAALQFLKKEKYLNHWMVMDDHAYRLETNTERAGAQGNFNDTEMAKALSNIFDDLLYNKGRELVSVA